jgi:hypothetical protein
MRRRVIRCAKRTGRETTGADVTGREARLGVTAAPIGSLL